MKQYIYISLGGFLGAILRFAIKNIYIYQHKGSIPLNTLIVNVTGSFILALFLMIAFETCHINKDVRLGISVGFLGAYTTFSTLCKETVTLMMQGLYFSAIFYVAASVILGLAAIYIGTAGAKRVVAKLLKKNEADLDEELIQDADGEVR